MTLGPWEVLAQGERYKGSFEVERSNRTSYEARLVGDVDATWAPSQTSRDSLQDAETYGTVITIWALAER
jgi:hypothetical protein